MNINIEELELIKLALDVLRYEYGCPDDIPDDIVDECNALLDKLAGTGCPGLR